jgi:hypothetical protein
MMYKIFIILLLSGSACYSQNIEWVKKKNSGFSAKEIFCDEQGNIYEYGWRGYWTNDTTGSFLCLYTPEGDLLFKKEWKTSFYLNKMIYHNGNLYFTGFFRNNIILDGITLFTKGDHDGIFGKMNSDGKMLFIKTLSGAMVNSLNGLSLSPDKASIILTGAVSDTVHYNNQMISYSSEIEMLLLKIDLSGNLLKTETFNFAPDQYDVPYVKVNSGIEIITTNSGRVYLLYDREGVIYNYGQEEFYTGRYIAEIDVDFKIIWTKRYNGPDTDSEYGWSFRNIQANSEGDLFALFYVEYRHGGNGKIFKINSDNGEVIWSYGYLSGFGYKGYAIDNSDNIFLIGNEGSNDIPDVGAHHGYQVIKKLSKNKDILGETRLYYAGISTITISKSQNIYIGGHLRRETVELGLHIVQNQGNPHFLAKVLDIPCTPPKITLNIGMDEDMVAYVFCRNSTAELNAEGSYTDYLWSNGAYTQKIDVSEPGSFKVRVIEESGCVSNSDSVRLEFFPNPTISISIRNININLKRNYIYWIPHNSLRANHFKIYRFFEEEEEYFMIDTLSCVPNSPYGYTYEYVDRTVDATLQAYKYKISYVDYCGFESELSQHHRPILLTIEDSAGFKVLKWNNYEGIVSGYALSGSLYQLGPFISVIAHLPAGTNRYLLSRQEIIQNNFFRISTFDAWSNSVPSGSNVTAINDLDLLGQVEIYPNPAINEIYLHIKGNLPANFSLSNSLGQLIFINEVYSNDETISLQDIQPGLYILSYDNGFHKKYFKIIKN